MDDHEEEVEDAHSRTFSWILSDTTDNKLSLDPPTDSVPMAQPTNSETYPSWSQPAHGVSCGTSFVSWLRDHSQPVFWISGKAGSGKSTLMKYIRRDERTRRYLSDWALGANVVLASFFFFERGNELQK